MSGSDRDDLDGTGLPTSDSICWTGFGEGLGLHAVVDEGSDPCVNIFTFPFVHENGQVQVTTSARPPGGTFTWSVTQPGNQVSLSSNSGSQISLTSNGPSEHKWDIVLRVTYHYVDQYGPGSVSDQMKLTAIRRDIAVCRAPVIDENEPLIDDTLEDSIGGQTWVNLDNDDQDDKFDDVDNEVANGDDELIKVLLRIQPSDLDAGGMSLRAVQGDANIKVWRDREKSFEHELGYWLHGGDVYWMREAGAGYSTMTDADGSWKVRELFVEGLEPSATQRETVLQVNFEALSVTDTCDNPVLPTGLWPDSDEVSLTFLGVQSLYWLGRNNGYGPPDHTQGSLDDCPNNPVLTLPTGDPILNKRVFADARAADPANAMDTVELEVTVSPPPVEELDLYVRSFDLDDPSAVTEIDPNDGGGTGLFPGSSIPYTEHDDNRGTVGGNKAGQFVGEDTNRVAPIHFAANTPVKTIDFTTTHRAGDNFIAVVNGDRDFLARLENLDRDDHFGVYDPVIRASGPGQGLVQQQPPDWHYLSDALTVWRILHVEIDSMVAVPAPPAGGHNRVQTTLSGLRNGSTELVVSSTLSDGSPELPSEPGRFERGRVDVGTGGGTATFAPPFGNGPDFVLHTGTVLLPFTLTATGQPSLAGNVTALTGTTYTIALSGGTLTSSYSGGTLRVTGVDMTVTSVNSIASSVTVSSNAVPVVLWDDDDESLLPIDLDFSQMVDAYGAAYYRPEADGGTALANNQHNVALDANTNQVVDPLMEQGTPATAETDVFWVAYLAGAYQWLETHDNDPDDGEGQIGGVCEGFISNSLVASGGDSSWVFVETCRDRETNDLPVASPNLARRVVCHEIGHQLGLDHLPGTLMNVSSQTVQPNPGFGNIHLNLLRCRLESPHK